jgi:MtN3 and saliva related transmembrane protein
VKNRARFRIVLAATATVVGLAALGQWLVASGELRNIVAFLAPAFSLQDTVGFVAGLGTTFAALPDLVGMLKRRSSRGVHPRMAGIMGAFQVLWIWYGLLIESYPVIVWNIIAVFINVLLVGFFLRFSRLEEKGTGPISSG